MRRALLLIFIWLTALGASVAPAGAGFEGDKQTCVHPGQDFDAGIEACSRQLRTGRYKGNNLAIMYTNRGISYANRWNEKHDARDVELSMADFSQAIEVNPRYANAYINLGNAWRRKNDNDRALVDYNEAIRLEPKRNAIAYNNRGNSYRDKGDNDLAIADYNQALEIDSKYAFAYNNRGNVYRDKGDVDRALADYNEAIRLDPRYAVAYNNRANAYRGKGELDRAIADYNDAIRVDPKYADAYVNRGGVYRDKNDTDRAIADYNEAMRADPNNAVAYASRAFVYNNKGDFDRAIADYSEAIRINPKYALAFTNRGNSYRSKGDNDRAIADYSDALRVDPAYAPAFTNRGLVYEKKGDVAHARSDFNEAARIPLKNDSGKWALDTARQRLAALSAPSAPAAPVTPIKPATVTTAVIAATAPTSVNDRRIALVIGNSAYENVPALPNPERDAAFVAETLKRTGFASVTVLTNLRKDALVSALRNFATQAETADWAVVYYAGHGMEVGGINYLIPTDARIAADRDIGFEAVPLDQVLNAAERAKKLRLVILDACRDNPFANQMKRTLTVASRSVTRGLAAVEPEAGTLVVYSAKDGETALDGEGGANSPFAIAFAKNLQTPGLEVRRLFDFVRDDVMDITNRRQKPFSYGSISGRQDFYFVAAK
jgi:tetratricopeptide (TPR) repeat protein